MAWIQYTMTVDGTGKMEVAIRGRNKDLSPVYKPCYVFSLEVDLLQLVPTLTAESIWIYGYDLSTILDEVVQALYDAMDIRRLCDGECDHLSMDYDSSGSYELIVESSFRWPWHVTSRNPQCSLGPDEELVTPRFTLSVSGQQTRKIDLKPALAALNTAGLSHPDLNPSHVSEWQAVISAALAAPELIAEEYEVDQEYQYDTTNLSLNVNFTTKIVTLLVHAASQDFLTTITYSGVSGSFDNGGSLTLTGKSSEETNGPLTEDEIYDDFSTSIGPSSLSTENQHGLATLDVTFQFHATETTPPGEDDRTFTIDVSIDESTLTAEGYSSSTNVITVDGGFLEQRVYDPELLDPGFRTACVYDFTHVNRRHFNGLCGPQHFHLHVAAETGYAHPKKRHPKCEYDIWPVRIPNA